MTQNTELLIYNGARVLPEHLIVQVIEHKNGGWDLNPKKEVKVTHIPTGLSTSCMDDRSEHRNCDLAKQKLAALLLQASANTNIDPKVGQVYETRNGGIATVTSLLGEGFRCEHSNGMNYWHNAQGIANLGDIRTKNCLVPTDFDLVAPKNGLSDQTVKPTYLTMEDLADAAGILAAHGHKALSEKLLAEAEALDAFRIKPKNKYSAGPWRYLQGGIVGELVVKSDTHPDLSIGIASDIDTEANARLIASAPELLEALIDCREALRQSGATGELKVVDAAIAKARGEA